MPSRNPSMPTATITVAAHSFLFSCFSFSHMLRVHSLWSFVLLSTGWREWDYERSGDAVHNNHTNNADGDQHITVARAWYAPLHSILLWVRAYLGIKTSWNQNSRTLQAGLKGRTIPDPNTSPPIFQPACVLLSWCMLTYAIPIGCDVLILFEGAATRLWQRERCWA